MLKKIPHTYVIIFLLILLAAAMTWVIPGGSFTREKLVVNGIEREIVKSGSFRYTENYPQTWEVFSAFAEGFTQTADIIVFILMIGGAFWIMNNSKAIDVGIHSFLQSAHSLERLRWIRRLGANNLIMLFIMLVFSLFGAVFGMSEETIAFTVIFVPLAISMGYDSITGVSLCFVAAALGFAGAMLNPFTVGIAQGLSDLPLFSGIEYRFFCWIVLNVIGFGYIMWYARKIKKTPQKSLVYHEDHEWRKKDAASAGQLQKFVPKQAWYVFVLISAGLLAFSIQYPMSTIMIGNSRFVFPAVPIATGVFILSSIPFLLKTVHYFILNLLVFTIVFLIIGVMGYGWYIMEIASLFLAMGLFSGISMGNKANELVALFLEGARDILSAALVVGLARGIIIILEQGQVIDTILYAFSGALSGMGKISTMGTMYLFQNLLNIFVPSGSGQAALTIPLMSQLSDLTGISRQATVLIFQFGDGFTNLITPTAGVLIGVLGVAKIPYDKWFRWVWPLVLILIITGFLLLIPVVTMQISGF